MVLRRLEKTTKSIWAKIFFGVLALSFALWGIGGDMFRTKLGNPVVATAGDVNIDRATLQKEVAVRVEGIRQQLGGNFTMGQAKEFGVVDSTLNDLIIQALYLQETQDLGLAVPDDQVRQLVLDNPNMRLPDGSLNRQLFQRVLQQQGITEDQFIKQTREDLARVHLIQALRSGAMAPVVLAEQVYLGRNQKRIVEVAQFLPNQYRDRLEPAKEEDLQAYYKRHSDRYMAPEYRDITYLHISPEHMTEAVEISEDDAKAEFEANIDAYSQPEKRNIEQFLIAVDPNASDEQISEAETLAKTASALAKKEPKSDLGKSLKSMDTDSAGVIKLEDITKDSLVPGLSEAVFSMKKGEISEPIHSPYGWHVVKVHKITPAKVPSFASVKKQIVEKLEKDAKTDAFASFVNGIEDAIAGGMTLEEAASKFHVTLLKAQSFDTNGKDTKNQSVQTASNPLIRDVAFKTDQGFDSGLVEFNDQYFLIRVDNITPSAVKPFGVVRNDVNTEYQMEKVWEIAQAEAEKAKGVLTEGKDFQAAMRATEHQWLTTAPMNRETAEKSMPAVIVSKMYSGKIDDFILAKDQEGYNLAKVMEVHSVDLPKDKAELDKIAKELNGQISNDIVDQFTQALKEKYDVTIHKGVVDDMFKDESL